MADLHGPSKRTSPLTTLILVAVILLAIIYFLAKGCTNKERGEINPNHSGATHVDKLNLVHHNLHNFFV